MIMRASGLKPKMAWFFSMHFLYLWSILYILYTVNQLLFVTTLFLDLFWIIKSAIINVCDVALSRLVLVLLYGKIYSRHWGFCKPLENFSYANISWFTGMVTSKYLCIYSVRLTSTHACVYIICTSLQHLFWQ